MYGVTFITGALLISGRRIWQLRWNLEKLLDSSLVEVRSNMPQEQKSTWHPHIRRISRKRVTNVGWSILTYITLRRSSGTQMRNPGGAFLESRRLQKSLRTDRIE